MQIGRSGPWGKCMKQTEGQGSRSHEDKIGHKQSFLATFLKNYLLHIIIMLNVNCITTTGMPEVKGQGHTKMKTDVKAW